MKKQLLSAVIITLFTCSVSAQNVNIPDVNFKTYLLGNASINTVADGDISVAEAANFDGVILCAGLGIADLTGIEAFTGTIRLDCSGNLLTTLDLSANTGLWNHLYVNGNQLTSIILPTSSSITQFTCSNNQLTSLDLSTTPGITTMWAMNNSLSSIDFSNSAAMEGMNIDAHQMSTLDLSVLPNLTWLSTSSSSLTSLDISSCTVLNNLYCDYSDSLTELNMANGNNMNFPPNWFSATECPNLTCVTVDNVSFANAVWAGAVDAGVTFSLNCTSSTTLATSLTIQGQGGINTITTQGGTLQIVPTVLPASAAGQTIYWGIAVGASLATVSPSGLLTANDNGDVTVGALTSDGSNLSATTVITISNQVVGLTTLLDAQMTVSPNPAISHLLITTQEPIESVTIFNLLGNLVQQEQTPAFSIEGLATGVYLINVTTSNGFSQTRFVKE